MNTHGLVVDFGKWRGHLYSEVPNQYLEWMVRVGHTKISVAKTELIRRYSATPIIIIHDKSSIGRHSREDFIKEKYGEVNYAEDIDFWTRVSPGTTFDFIKDTGANVTDAQWKRLCNECQSRGL